ncbi:hypothetical protein [Armatimonas sp.]|uniref:hypothetical protein n=1 Tax=Armatimonas sp. TaxID=1872638 RepID=UPI00286BB6EF|nr:hypothetical protein [Armatimonas sp.]
MGLCQKTNKGVTFAGTTYSHRWARGDQHEFTSKGQEDLKKWTDMVTLIVYPKVTHGEGLAVTANTVLGNYKASKATVLRTDSVPRTESKPAEHLIVVMFGRPEFVEVAFTRLRLHKGVGNAVVYSHRIYGKKAGNAASAWLKKNGPSTEKALMAWDAMPESFLPKA